MYIGDPKHTYTIEPEQLPLPFPEPAPEEEPEHEPAAPLVDEPVVAERPV